MSLEKLASRIRDITSKIESNIEEDVQDMGKEVFKTVISNTPYRTGQARSSWRAKLNQPSSFKRKPYGSGIPYSNDDTFAPSGWGINAESAFKAGMVQIKKFSVDDDAIVLFNNQKYINGLNDGNSTQAPANFVERSRVAGASRALKTKILRDIK